DLHPATVPVAVRSTLGRSFHTHQVLCGERRFFRLKKGLARQDSGHWWSSFFFGKQNQMGTLTGSESQQKAGTYTVTNGQVTCIAREIVMKRQMSESSDSGKEPGSPVPS
uniref:Pancreatic progenitor cell differentiation and proliferation factor a n=1 Tax=Cyprinus carpio carpio TaxID=630221 RepID=A0A8C1B194_CYPCA